MVVIVLALVVADYQDDFAVPLWVIFSVAVALALGTYAGGWRIIRTLGRRIVHLDPPSGFGAETTAAAVLYTTAFVYEVPVSTTHTITSAVSASVPPADSPRSAGASPATSSSPGFSPSPAPGPWPPRRTCC